MAREALAGATGYPPEAQRSTRRDAFRVSDIDCTGDARSPCAGAGRVIFLVDVDRLHHRRRSRSSRQTRAVRADAGIRAAARNRGRTHGRGIGALAGSLADATRVRPGRRPHRHRQRAWWSRSARQPTGPHRLRQLRLSLTSRTRHSGSQSSGPCGPAQCHLKPQTVLLPAVPNPLTDGRFASCSTSQFTVSSSRARGSDAQPSVYSGVRVRRQGPTLSASSLSGCAPGDRVRPAPPPRKASPADGPKSGGGFVDDQQFERLDGLTLQSLFVSATSRSSSDTSSAYQAACVTRQRAMSAGR